MRDPYFLSDFEKLYKKSRSSDYFTTQCWPPLGWDHVIKAKRTFLEPLFRLIAFGIVYQYFELDKTTKEASNVGRVTMGVDPSVYWREVYWALKVESGILNRTPSSDDPVYEETSMSLWLKVLMKTHTSILPKDYTSWTVPDSSFPESYPVQKIEYYHVSAAISFGETRDGDLIAGHSIVRLEKLGWTPDMAELDHRLWSGVDETFYFGLIVREVDSTKSGNYPSIFKTEQSEAQSSRRQDENGWIIVCPCILTASF
ncbi:hypothetical protein GLAREA_12170 [Glarea lozoyensis ATCC 20868]|uniref:Uncharacterized protein n=1 Tax=Glarea lozoyensis (strain ATCC 20868 / MF5171) TaxID=1116229 RepID=S3E0M8_GLAL2|nr:uncharacterized protein GLAREA_12170 [Glarea lozoyensis ATCC 20868]EPE32088.1 hypothetical protein GLAREA_12170 [Glarea lozoyensis ATCC 20868]